MLCCSCQGVKLAATSILLNPFQCYVNRIQDTEAKYYANGEDAYEMRKYFASAKRRSSKGDKGDGKGSKGVSSSDGAAAKGDAGGASTADAAGAVEVSS